MTTPLPDYRQFAPHAVPQSLADRHGPAEGTVALPLHLSWSGPRQFDVTELTSRLLMYQIVIVEGDRSDLEGYLDADHLLSVWPRLRRMLGPGYRTPWESRFPELVEAARAAEPALREELRSAREAVRAEHLP